MQVGGFVFLFSILIILGTSKENFEFSDNEQSTYKEKE
jgi:hypothetical protein